MQNDDYKKSYKGLVLFFVIFLSVLVAAGILAAVFAEQHSMRITINTVSIAMVALTFIIYKTEKIYWLNNTTYKAALEAGSERREAFALAHLKRFAFFAAALAVVSCVLALLGQSQIIDFTLGVIGLCAVAISTIKIKL